MVIKRKRTLSELEVIHNSYKLRINLSRFILRDFGIKTKIRDTHLMTISKDLSEHDKELINYLEESYSISKNKVIDSFPDWFIEYERKLFMTITYNIMMHLTNANSIYPKNLHELEIRNEYQLKAIGCCETLLQELNFLANILPNPNLNVYMPHVKDIEYQIQLIKSWRKSDNKIKTKLKESNQE